MQFFSTVGRTVLGHLSVSSTAESGQFTFILWGSPYASVNERVGPDDIRIPSTSDIQ